MTLKNLHKKLSETDAEDLFGELGSEHPDYKKWAILCHPDKNNSELATETFKLLQQRASEAVSGVQITSKKNKYEVKRTPFAVGDICDIYLDKRNDRVLKVSRAEDLNGYMKREEEVLKDLEEYLDTDMKPFIIELKEIFSIGQRNFPKRKTHCLGYFPGMTSVDKVKEQFPRGIDARNFGWIFRRLLFCTAILHQKGWVHGAINPTHFAIHDENHVACLLDYIHAVKPGEVVKVKTKNKDFYPKEILEGKPASFESDIYMVGKLGLYLLGGHLPSNSVSGSKVPSKIRNFLKVLLAENPSKRPSDALELHDDFKECLARCFGPPKYVNLGLKGEK